MADGAGKIAAQKEVAQAQEALLGGKIGACAMHLSRAMHAGTMNQARPKPQPKPRSIPMAIETDQTCAVSLAKRPIASRIGPSGRRCASGFAAAAAPSAARLRSAVLNRLSY